MDRRPFAGETLTGPKSAATRRPSTRSPWLPGSRSRGGSTRKSIPRGAAAAWALPPFPRSRQPAGWSRCMARRPA